MRRFIEKLPKEFVPFGRTSHEMNNSIAFYSRSWKGVYLRKGRFEAAEWLLSNYY
jgi:hypothetical protein